MCSTFIRQLGYKGHIGVELKYDERDSIYKLIEVNPRFGLWDGLPTLCGMDFSLINCRYLHGQSISRLDTFEDGVK